MTLTTIGLPLTQYGAFGFEAASPAGEQEV